MNSSFITSRPVFGREEVFENNKGAEQPAHLRSLIRTFVIHFLENSISELAMSEI